MRQGNFTTSVIVAAATLVMGCVGEPTERQVAVVPPSITHAALLAYIAAANATEIEEGRLAKQEAATTDVQAYGNRMIQEHDALLLQGTLVAQDLSINPEVAPKGRYLLSAHVADIGELREKTGLGFARPISSTVLWRIRPSSEIWIEPRRPTGLPR